MKKGQKPDGTSHQLSETHNIGSYMSTWRECCDIPPLAET